jgi:type IV pilus assembly protein PilA
MVTEGLNLAGGAKVTVAENLANGADACAGVDEVTKGKTTLICSGAGVLTATVATGTSASDVDIVLTPNAQGDTWSCTSESPAKYVPATCRAAAGGGV